jgi:hypothetical protein
MAPVSWSVRHRARMSACTRSPMDSSNPLFMSRMWLLQRGSTRGFSVFAWSATSERAVVRCKPANVRSCCCLRRAAHSVSLHRTMEMANSTSLSRFLLPSWRDGKHSLRRTESLSKRSAPGIWVARAYTFGIPTAICWKLPRQASGRSIEVVRTVEDSRQRTHRVLGYRLAGSNGASPAKLPYCRHLCKLSRAFGPRNSMKIA